MQRDKTIQYWDNFYSQQTFITLNNDTQDRNDSTTCTNVNVNVNVNTTHNDESSSTEKEWIVRPSESLFASILQCLPANINDSINDGINDGINANINANTIGNPNENMKNQSSSTEILEIGCGNSHLSKEFWLYIMKEQTKSFINTQFSLTATDVSSVCIQQMLHRDTPIIQSSNGHFTYEKLNVLHKNTSIQLRYDMILDKGCLDTFLYRTQHKMQWEIMSTLLDNIHSWLKPRNGLYIILSPRSKIKPVRDYVGFQSVERVELRENSPSIDNIIIGDLNGRRAIQANKNKNKNKNENAIYMYICRKNDAYIPGERSPFKSNSNEKIESSDDNCGINKKQKCNKCGLLFEEFIGSDVDMGQGEKTWLRRFRNHCVHCQA